MYIIIFSFSWIRNFCCYPKRMILDFFLMLVPRLYKDSMKMSRKVCVSSLCIILWISSSVYFCVNVSFRPITFLCCLIFWWENFINNPFHSPPTYTHTQSRSYNNKREILQQYTLNEFFIRFLVNWARLFSFINLVYLFPLFCSGVLSFE